MTENDYIAEYIKEKHPDLLGLNYDMWKFKKYIKRIGDQLRDVFNKLPDDYKKELYLEDGDVSE